MGIYSFNIALDGYTSVEIGVESNEIKDSVVIYAEPENLSSVIASTYIAIKQLIDNNNRVIFLFTSEKNMALSCLTSLMISEQAYDIYKVESIESVDSEFVESLIAREPSFLEAQNFLSEFVAYETMGEALVKIHNSIIKRDLGELIENFEKNYTTLGELVGTFDYMKAIILEYSIGDSMEKIGKIQKESEELRGKLVNYSGKITELEEQNKSLVGDIDKHKASMEEASEKIANLKKQLSAPRSGGEMFASYRTIDMSTIKYSVGSVVYFKEITQIPYINSFVLNLFGMLEGRKRVKLVIYDNKSVLSHVYNPISYIGSQEYVSRREHYSSEASKVVVVEPNPSIIEDIVKCQEKYDVVIIYDRLRQQNDIITGNNVHKYWVANSMRDITCLQTIMKIDLQSTFIGASSQESGCIKIPTLTGYNDQTTSGKIGMYKDIKTSNGSGLIESIMRKCNLI